MIFFFSNIGALGCVTFFISDNSQMEFTTLLDGHFQGLSFKHCVSTRGGTSQKFGRLETRRAKFMPRNGETRRDELFSSFKMARRNETSFGSSWTSQKRAKLSFNFLWKRARRARFHGKKHDFPLALQNRCKSWFHVKKPLLSNLLNCT